MGIQATGCREGVPRDHRPSPPHPGERRFAVVVTAVMVVISLAGLLTAVIASRFVEGLGATIVACVAVLGASLAAFLMTAVQRRRYLRARLYGDPVVRRPPWESDLDTTHTW